MTGRADMIDLVGRAAARLDLNAPSGNSQAEKPRAENPQIEPWFNETGPRLEPTILASLAAEARAAPASPVPTAAPAPPAPESHADVPGGAFETLAAAAMIEAAADAQHRENAKDLARAAKITVANQIALNWTRLAQEGYLTPHNQTSIKGEEFRIIKRPLLRAAFSPEKSYASTAHMVMVTSPGPGDGKTFNAINLAISIASERDLQVLLIDADPRSRGLSKVLGLAGRRGLTELLSDPELAIDTVSLRTDIPNLAIIPAGQPVGGSTEMMASQAMTRLVRDISTRYKNRVIIFDAPPVLASSEPGVLAAHVGQIVMVVRAFETGKRSIARALNQVSECPKISFIVNRISIAAAPDRYEYYGYAVESTAPAAAEPSGSHA